jgi:hypothetical protein
MTPAEIIILGTFLLAVSAGAHSVYRQRITNLPLTIAQYLACNRVGETDTYHLRIALGRGRPMQTPQVNAVYTDSNGEHTTLEVNAPTSGRVIGPVTLIIRDPAQALRVDGTLHISASTRAMSKDWQANMTVAHTQFIAGRFAPVIRSSRNGISIHHRAWQTIHEQTS